MGQSILLAETGTGHKDSQSYNLLKRLIQIVRFLV